MIPVGHIGIERRTIPFVTYALLGINVLVFLFELFLGRSLFFSDNIDVTRFFLQWGLIPYRTHQRRRNYRTPLPSNRRPQRQHLQRRRHFPHPDLGHRLHLHVHPRRLATPSRQHALPLGLRRQHRRPLRDTSPSSSSTSVPASPPFGPHVALNMDSNVPLVGASGAIAGVTGAYLVLFPFGRIRTPHILRLSSWPSKFPQSSSWVSGLFSSYSKASAGWAPSTPASPTGPTSEASSQASSAACYTS